MIDSTIVRAHQQRAGTKESCAEQEELGRRAGSRSTKIHAVAEALGNPIQFFLTPGQANDLQGADALLPHIPAEALLADKAVDVFERVVLPLTQRRIEVVIPSKDNRKEPRPYDKALYQARHLVENFFAKLKPFRAIATRYEKRSCNFLSGIYLASCVILLA
jgi:transposase